MARKKYKKDAGAALPATFKPRFWNEADGRYGVVRVIRSKYEELKADTAADCFQKDMLCQRAVFIAVQLETMETNAIEGGEFELAKYTQCVNALVGLLKALGLKKQVSDVVDLKSYVEANS